MLLAVGLRDMRKPSATALRFLSLLEGVTTVYGKPSFSVAHVSHWAAAHVLLQWAGMSRSFSTEADTFPHLKEILRVFDMESSTMDYQQLNTAFQNVPTNWDSKCLFGKVFKHIKDPHTALNFFFWVTDEKKLRPSTVEYNAVLETLGAGNMFTSMHMVMKHMDMKKCRMLPSTFTILIKYYGKAGRIDDATRTLAEMKRCGVQPNVQTYNNLINAFLRDGKVELVLGMYQQMISDGIHPNEYTIRFFVDGLCGSGQLSEARKLVQESAVSNIFVYNVLLKGFCRAGKVEEGYQVLEEMIARGCLPDEYTYNTLVVGSCKAGKLDFALKMREEMIEKKISPTLITYGTLIMFLCRQKRAEEAFQLLGHMKSEGIVLTQENQSSLKTAFMRTKRKTSAALLIREMTSGP